MNWSFPNGISAVVLPGLLRIHLRADFISALFAIWNKPQLKNAVIEMPAKDSHDGRFMSSPFSR